MMDVYEGPLHARKNPLPCTQGRGQCEGTAGRDMARFASRGVSPLTPTLSPEYRGERNAAAEPRHGGGAMNIAILAAGAGGMYCGSCMRDNALAMALKRLGHSVTLIPLYSPLRSEQPQDATVSQVFYGGINVYLQHIGRLFRHTPRVFDWIFDRPWLLNAATDIGAQTSPRKLAGLTMSVLAGEEGAANKELTRLLVFLKQEIKPQIVLLPNAMFVGMARTFSPELGVPVVCELTGEDIFLDAMNDVDRVAVRDAIRKRATDVTRFVATSKYYAGRMAEYLDVARERVDVVSSGISREYLAPIAQAFTSRPPTIGYLARICPEKGLDRLIDALEILLRRPDQAGVQLKTAGYLGNRALSCRKWFWRDCLPANSSRPVSCSSVHVSRRSRSAVEAGHARFDRRLQRSDGLSRSQGHLRSRSDGARSASGATLTWVVPRVDRANRRRHAGSTR